MTNSNTLQTFNEAEYAGWIFDNHLMIGDKSGYYPSVQAYKKQVRLEIDRGLLKLEDLCDYVMGCEVERPLKISARHIADLSVTELYEIANSEFSEDSLEALQLALDAFYEANAHIQLPVPDWKIKVLLDWSSIETEGAIA